MLVFASVFADINDLHFIIIFVNLDKYIYY